MWRENIATDVRMKRVNQIFQVTWMTLPCSVLFQILSWPWANITAPQNVNISTDRSGVGTWFSWGNTASFNCWKAPLADCESNHLIRTKLLSTNFIYLHDNNLSNALISSKLQHPPPIPWAIHRHLIIVWGGGAGKLNRKCRVFPAEYKHYIFN